MSSTPETPAPLSFDSPQVQNAYRLLRQLPDWFSTHSHLFADALTHEHEARVRAEEQLKDASNSRFSIGELEAVGVDPAFFEALFKRRKAIDAALSPSPAQQRIAEQSEITMAYIGTADALAKAEAERDVTRDALQQIFAWWDMNDGHLTTHFSHAVSRKMESLRAAAPAQAGVKP